MVKEYLSKVESSIGLSAGVGAFAYLSGLPFHIIAPYMVLGFIGGYFGKKFLGNVLADEKSMVKE